MELTNAEKQVIWIAPGSHIDEAINLMEEFQIHHLPVVHDREVVGMLSDRDLLLAVGWKLACERQLARQDPRITAGPETVSEIMSEPPITLKVGTSFAWVAAIMSEKKIGAIPLCRGGHVEGLITESDLLWALLDQADQVVGVRKFLDDSVNAVMTKDVVTAGPKTAIIDVLTLFKDHHIRHLPVTTGNELLGMISDRDVLRALGEALINDAQAEMKGTYYMGPQHAMDVMTQDVITVPSDETISVAVRTLLQHHIHALPVVDHDQLTGILTESDLVRNIALTGMLDAA